MKKAYSYLRASTNIKMQANSIAIQESVIANFASTHGYDVVECYVEYKSGGDDSREVFNTVLQRCIEENATLITWKCDRLSRSLSVFSLIQDHLHLLRFCELGDMQPDLLTLSVLLGVAHKERINIGERVKACYQTLKAKDPNHPWGNPNMADKVQPIGERVRKANAMAFNKHIQQLCNDFNKAGYCTLDKLAVKLNEVGVTTRRGKTFNKNNLQRILAYGA